jgi:hypothetical protein
MKKNALFMILFSVLCLCVAILGMHSRDVEKTTPTIQLSGIENINVLSNNSGVLYYEATSGNQIIIKIKQYKDVEPNDKENLLREEFSFLDYQYRIIESPYPETITNKVLCPDEFKPVFHNDSSHGYYTLYASERFTYGVCAKELIKYNSLIGPKYCGNELYLLQLFSEGSFDNLQKGYYSIKCK